MKRRKRCQWCGKLIPLGKELRRYDCADVAHYFHRECWAEHCRWMSDRAHLQAAVSRPEVVSEGLATAAEVKARRPKRRL